MSTVWKCELLLTICALLGVVPGCHNRQVFISQPLLHSQDLSVSTEAMAFDEGAIVRDARPGPPSDVEALSPLRAAEIAVLDNPALQTARAERGIACAQIIQAGILPNPQMSASFDSPAFGATAGTVTADAESISWDISKLRPLEARIDSATANAEAVDLDIVWQEWQVAQAARQAVYDLAALENQREALENGRAILEKNLSLVERAVDEGNLTIVDLAAAQSAAIAVRGNSLAVEREIRQQHVLVNRILGRPPASPVSVDSTVEFEDEISLPPVTQLLAMTETRPDLLALQRSYESQEQALRAAINARIPATNVSLTRASDTSVVGTLGAGISVDLQVFDRNQGAIAAECALRDKIREKYNQQVFTARSEVDSALADIRALEQQVTVSRESIPLFQNLVDTYDDAVRQNNANVLVYYLAFNDLVQQQVELWRLRQQLIDARIALETALGTSIDR